MSMVCATLQFILNAVSYALTTAISLTCTLTFCVVGTSTAVGKSLCIYSTNLQIANYWSWNFVLGGVMCLVRLTNSINILFAVSNARHIIR